MSGLQEIPISFWLGIAFALPVGILANLISTPIQTRLQKHNQKAAERKKEKNQSEEALAAQLARDPSLLYRHVLKALMEIAYFGAVFSLASGASFAIGNAAPFSALFFLLGQIFALVGAIIVMNISSRVIKLIYRVEKQ